jgi:shikimate kinase
MWTSFIGFMASGKTTLTARLRESTSRPTVSTDQLVVRKTGLSINEIFAREGEQAFRLLEMEILQDLDADRNLVVDTGGGLLESPESVSLLRDRGVVIWLDVPWDDIRARLRNSDDEERPLLKELGWPGLEHLYRRRRRLYAASADFRLVKGSGTVEHLARQAMLRSLLWQRRREGNRS